MLLLTTVVRGGRYSRGKQLCAPNFLFNSFFASSRLPSTAGEPSSRLYINWIILPACVHCKNYYGGITCILFQSEDPPPTPYCCFFLSHKMTTPRFCVWYKQNFCLKENSSFFCFSPASSPNSRIRSCTRPLMGTSRVSG